jgi:hypothetical protein
VTRVTAFSHCFNDLYIKIFPTMLRIGRSRIHHCYSLSFNLQGLATKASCKQAFIWFASLA